MQNVLSDKSGQQGLSVLMFLLFMQLKKLKLGLPPIFQGTPTLYAKQPDLLFFSLKKSRDHVFQFEGVFYEECVGQQSCGGRLTFMLPNIYS